MSLAGMVLEVSARMRIGEAEGFDFRKLGSVGMSAGMSAAAALMAACTSWAAPTMSRVRSNWMEMREEPWRVGRGQLVDPGDLAEAALQRRGDACGHGLGIGARQAGVDANGRELDRGKAGDRKVHVGHGAQQEEADGQQGGADRPFDEGPGEVHGLLRRPPGHVRRVDRRHRAARRAPQAPTGPARAPWPDRSRAWCRG